jgi:DNA polymerase I-like protein with 3'-5' exonuclease and polymerase domains
MKSGEEKLKQKQLLQEFKKKEKEDFVSSLPIAADHFFSLFNVLNEKLEDEPCDHTLRFTEQYLNRHQLPLHSVISWLNENGGYCDCEVLLNVEEKFEGLERSHENTPL